MFKFQSYPIFDVVICLLVLLAGGLILHGHEAWRHPDLQAAAFPEKKLDSTGASPLFLESYFKDPGLYETPCEGHPPRKVRMRAGIVPHHFLARDLMAEFFGSIDPREVATVILAGPDHFKNPRHPPDYLCSTLLPWKTPFGMLEPQREGILELVEQAGAVLRDDLFLREHAIYTLIPFVKKTFPQARVIPLILRDRGGYEKFVDLGRRLGRQKKAIFIASTDFSHGVSPAEAHRLDEESLRHLKDLKLSELALINNDCRPCLAAALGFLGDGERNFLPLKRKTSGDYAGAGGGPVTSYLTGYYTLIIGSHPHVIQEKEEYRGKMIYYSLGNFVFDQYFREDTRRGLAVQVGIHPVTLQMAFKDHFLELVPNGQTFLRRSNTSVEGNSQGEYIRPKIHAVR